MDSSEARFRATFDDAPTGIALLATDRRLLTVNRALCEMLGRTEDELVGRTLDHLTHPDDLGQDPQGIAKMLAGEIPTFQRVKRYRRPDGRIVHGQAWASLVRDAEGEPSHFIVHIQDITALHEATRAEQEARRLLDESQQVAQVGSWSYALDTDELTWSDSEFRLHGVEPRPGPVSYDWFLALLPPEDRAGAAARHAARKAKGEGFTAEYRIIHRDGSEHTLVASAELLPADPDNGLSARVAGITRDVTAERATERENRMLVTMVQQSQDAIIAKDREGRVIEWNRGAERLYGYSREQMLGRPVAVIIGPERSGEDRELLAEALAGRSTQRDTIRRRRDGGQVNVSLSVSPLHDGAGIAIGALVIARDITPRIREQAARREVEERLRVTVDHAPIGVALVDLHDGARGRLLSANDAFAVLLGEPDPVVAELSLTSVLHPEDVGALRDDLVLLSCDEQARTETEVRCLRPDGTIVWLLLSGAAVPGGEDPAQPPRLAVVHALDIGERKRFEGRLQHLADHDALTGLFNRRRFESELARAVSHVRRYRQPGALLLIDLDGFKRVNDTMGHAYGDELITRIGATLRSVVRETDVIGRLGGDEFAIILTSVTGTEALAVGDKVLQAIQEHGIVLSESHHAGVTGSIGIAPMRAEDAPEAEELLARADTAMYAAKEAGRNRVAVSRGGGERACARQSWQARLRAAVQTESFELFAQPIRGICADGIERYELLLRMRDEDGELVAPAAFLPGAERYDLIQQIDRWVFARALALLRAHETAGHPIGLSVNMSGKTLCDPTLVDDLAAMVADCPIPRDRLIVEVTETAAIVNIERAREVARALRQLGCHFALDDFGAGFASFYYLKHLEFDFVKIDGEFVKALGENPTDQLVIRSVVDLARGLGAETIAEFVGDEEAIGRLRELGVDYGQGYHLGRPAPVGEILPAAIGR